MCILTFIYKIFPPSHMHLLRVHCFYCFCKDTAIFFKHQKQKDRSLQKTVKKIKL